jgi:hypothetical protein
MAMLKILIFNNVKNVILLEEGRFHNVFEDKPAKWPIAKKNPSKYTPTINLYNFVTKNI